MPLHLPRLTHKGSAYYGYTYLRELHCHPLPLVREIALPLLLGNLQLGLGVGLGVRGWGSS